jgi:hypothetical protein
LAERIQCEFFLIRYVPDVVKGEFTNIGVVLREADGASTETVVRFTRDWARVRCMDADADTGLLEALEGEIAERLRLGAKDTKPVMQLLEDTLSNSIQISEPRAALAESIPAELAQLMRMYVEPMKVKRERVRTGRAAIQATMRTEFERAGVWAMMRKRIAASLYTRPGDPMKLDCGYKALASACRSECERHHPHVPGGLAGGRCRWSERVWRGLRAATARRRASAWKRTDLELTAVVEPLRTVSEARSDRFERRWPRRPWYRFGVEAMEREAAIRVVAR